LGLGINAGHDLSLDNIQFFKQNIPVTGVSIGHVIAESLSWFRECSQHVFAKIK
jgi:pyridoxine 5-phosphate synthase